MRADLLMAAAEFLQADETARELKPPKAASLHAMRVGDRMMNRRQIAGMLEVEAIAARAQEMKNGDKQSD